MTTSVMVISASTDLGAKFATHLRGLHPIKAGPFTVAWIALKSIHTVSLDPEQDALRPTEPGCLPDVAATSRSGSGQ